MRDTLHASRDTRLDTDLSGIAPQGKDGLTLIDTDLDSPRRAPRTTKHALSEAEREIQ